MSTVHALLVGGWPLFVSCAALSGAVMIADLATGTVVTAPSMRRHRLARHRTAMMLGRTLYGVASVLAVSYLALWLGVRLPIWLAIASVGVIVVAVVAALVERRLRAAESEISVAVRIGAGLPTAIGVWSGICVVGSVAVTSLPAIASSLVLTVLLLIGLGLAGEGALGRLGRRPYIVAWFVVVGGIATVIAGALPKYGLGIPTMALLLALGLMLAALCVSPPPALGTSIDEGIGRFVISAWFVDLLLVIGALLVQSIGLKELAWTAVGLIVITAPLPWLLRLPPRAERR